MQGKASNQQHDLSLYGDWRESKKLTEEVKGEFLKVLAETGRITKAAAAVNCSTSLMSYHRKKDSEFAELWALADDMYSEKMVDEARRRAVEGVEKPVFWNGWEVARVIEYSDSLLVKCLQAKRTEYATVRTELTGKDGERLDFGAKQLTDEQLDARIRQLANQTGIAGALGREATAAEDPEN